MTNQKVFGVSTGDTGDYGIGDIVMGSVVAELEDGTVTLDGEPVYNIFVINNEELKYLR